MSTGTMVSLDEFIVFNTPNHSCNNKHYIGSDRLKTLTYAFLIGDNKIYQRHSSYWLLKAVLVEDKLLVDYSFEDIDLLEEQILILSAFDREVTIKWETLWEYFNVADIEELNNISRQLVDRRLDEIANPLKVFYNNAIDDGKTQLDYEGWEVEMNELFAKWKECEEARLLASSNHYTESEIDNYISSKDLEWFIREYYNNAINFYNNQVDENEVSTPEYTESLNFLCLSTGLGEVELCRNMSNGINNYLDYIINFIHTLSREDVVQYATVLYEYHMGKLKEITEAVEADYPF